MSELGDKLRRVRVSRGLTQQEAAALTGIPYKTINDYENGKSRPDVNKLARLCKAYNTSADYFIGIQLGTVSQNNLSDFELSFLQKYRSLDCYGRKAVYILLETELCRVRKQMEESISTEGRVDETNMEFELCFSPQNPPTHHE